jgi:hypothetical protein
MNATLQIHQRRTAQPATRRAASGIGTIGATRAAYLKTLAFAFALFNSVRVVAYLPTIWAIQQTGDASQHSIWTWLTWAGANATMAAWLYEENGQRANRAVIVSSCNASMCIATTALIVFYRCQ